MSTSTPTTSTGLPSTGLPSNALGSDPTLAIDTQDLTKRFGDFVAVDHLTLRVAAGQVLGFLGPNGSGKTTTIRMLLGLLHPDEGWARVLGYDVVAHPDEVRQRTGYMSQKFALYGEMTTLENLTFYAGVYGIRDRGRIRDVMDATGVTPVANRRVQNLSAGWRQRLALATAIVHKPGLLFLDEPTSGVDPLARRVFWDLIYELAAAGITVMVSTHYMDEAEYCDHVGIMRAGKLLALDEPTHLRKSLPGTVWEFFVDPMLPALEVVGKLAEVQRSSLASDHLRLVLVAGAQPEPVRAALEASSIRVTDVHVGEPTMEDVFLALSTTPEET